MSEVAPVVEQVGDVGDWFRRAAAMVVSPRITVTRRLTFCAGHRVYGHESKCAHPHGHNYVCHVEASAPELDAIGRVIDFAVLKERLGGWLDTKWDHAFLYFAGDEELAALFRVYPEWRSFVCPFNPTAENMARYVLTQVAPALFAETGITIDAIEIEETENCRARVALSA